MMMMILIVSAAVAVVRGVGERNSARASDGRRVPSPLWGNMFSLLPRQPHPCPMGADSLSAHAHVLNHFPFASPVCVCACQWPIRGLGTPARVDGQSARWELLPAALLPAVCSQLTVVTGAESLLLLLLLFWSFCTSVSGRDRGMIVWRSVRVFTAQLYRSGFTQPIIPSLPVGVPEEEAPPVGHLCIQ